MVPARTSQIPQGVVLSNLNSGGPGARLAAWFPDREFFMRSHGQVRFIKVSTRVQATLAIVALALVAGWVAVMIGLTAARSQQISLDQRAARVESAEHGVSAYRSDLNAAAEKLKKRQDVIEEMVGTLPAGARLDGAAAATGQGSAPQAADPALTKIGALVPEAAALARIEARQLAFVDHLTRYANQRADSASSAIRKLGLNPHEMLDTALDARGGPFERLSTEKDGSLHPSFARLGQALERMDALERGLDGIPQVLPASLSMISSGFGYRSDPFTGEAALHSGLDFRGPVGSPIYAAATGTISFQGVRNGYGNVVEISHGNGLVTRYAHMSAFHARPGQTVEAGDIIGAIGSTGRSTGPHLHFEVLIDGRAVNPRPFLEAAPHVLKEIRSRGTGRE